MRFNTRNYIKRSYERTYCQRFFILEVYNHKIVKFLSQNLMIVFLEKKFLEICFDDLFILYLWKESQKFFFLPLSYHCFETFPFCKSEMKGFRPYIHKNFFASFDVRNSYL